MQIFHTCLYCTTICYSFASGVQ